MRSQDFDNSVVLPPGLDLTAVRQSIEYIEHRAPELLDLYFERANGFSVVVGYFGTRALDSQSVYEKSRHSHTAQQRFPDLKHRNAPDPPAPDESLESKASKRPWALQSHYDHPGWYIVWRYLVDVTEGIESGRPVIIWRVDVAFLSRDDWKYESSTAGATGGGRTHTFGLKLPATRLRGCAAYRRSDIAIKDGKAVPLAGLIDEGLAEPRDRRRTDESRHRQHLTIARAARRNA